MYFSFFILPRDQKREVFEFLNSFKEKFAEIYVELKKNKQSHFLFTFFFFSFEHHFNELYSQLYKLENVTELYTY